VLVTEKIEILKVILRSVCPAREEDNVTCYYIRYISILLTRPKEANLHVMVLACFVIEVLP
jgi:hypothetical protein